MWYPPVVTVPPAGEPVSLADAKAHTRVDGTDDDLVLNGAIAAARANIEVYCGTPLMVRTVALKCDGFQDFTRLPLAPIPAVSSISYVDVQGVTQILPADTYELHDEGLAASIALQPCQSWPVIQPGSRITVTADAGYLDVPADIKFAVLLLVAHWNKYREAGARMTGGGEDGEIPFGVTHLLTNHRIFLC